MHAVQSPVTVLVGLGFPRRIATVSEAMTLLDEVPVLLRDEVHHAARDACRDAMEGLCPDQEALAVFVAYARRRRMLVEEECWIIPEGQADLAEA